MIRRPPSSTLFPYTPLSRSAGQVSLDVAALQQPERAAGEAGGAAGIHHRRVDPTVVDPHDGAGGPADRPHDEDVVRLVEDRKSTRLNSSHLVISYAVFCLQK